MNVLIGLFNTESNGNIPTICRLNNYDIAFGEECIDKIQVRNVFEKEGINIIPSIYANAGGAGVIEKNAFEYIESCFINCVKENIQDIDGIYLMLHGASFVEGIGSGDFHILKEIRKIVGPYLPIAVVCDPHGNLTKEYVESTQIIRSYRNSPHTDKNETYEKVAHSLCTLLKQREYIHSEYIKLPLILGGEQSVSADEPVKSINEYMDEMEKDPKILSASWHVGYIRHDCSEAGCGVVVVPKSKEYQDYAKQKVKELASYVWSKRHEFHYTGLTASPEEAMKMALEYPESPFVITDSGDNTTSGATGWNTYILNQVLQSKTNKSVLFVTIHDEKTFLNLLNTELNTNQSISLGVNYDEYSKTIDLNVAVKHSGKLCRFIKGKYDKKLGDGILVQIKNTNIDVIVSNTQQPIINTTELEYFGVDWTKYDIVVLKQGYIFPDFKKEAKGYVMSLTKGATPQDTASLEFKQIMRPMFPIDNI
mgnify:CR=1 FL=1